MRIHVKAKPGSKQAYIKKLEDADLFGAELRFVVAVQERAIEGRANHAIEKTVAEYFKVPVSRVRIVSGQASRAKVIEISGV